MQLNYFEINIYADHDRKSPPANILVVVKGLLTGRGLECSDVRRGAERPNSTSVCSEPSHQAGRSSCSRCTYNFWKFTVSLSQAYIEYCQRACIDLVLCYHRSRQSPLTASCMASTQYALNLSTRQEEEIRRRSSDVYIYTLYQTAIYQISETPQTRYVLTSSEVLGPAATKISVLR